MSNQKSNPWTSEDCDRLRVLFEQGKTDRWIGIEMRRTADSIRHQRAKLQLLRRERQEFTNQDEAELLAYIADEVPIYLIAKHMKRHKSVIDFHMTRLGVPRGTRPRKRTKTESWPPESDPWAVKVRFDDISSHDRVKEARRDSLVMRARVYQADLMSLTGSTSAMAAEN